MLLLFSIRVAERPPVLERPVIRSAVCVFFVNVYQSVCVRLSLLILRAGCKI